MKGKLGVLGTIVCVVILLGVSGQAARWRR